MDKDSIRGWVWDEGGRWGGVRVGMALEQPEMLLEQQLNISGISLNEDGLAFSSKNIRGYCLYALC